MPSQNCLCVNGPAGQLSSQTKPCLSAYQLQTPAPVLLTTDMQGQPGGSTSRALLPERVCFNSLPLLFFFYHNSWPPTWPHTALHGMTPTCALPNSHSYCGCIYLHRYVDGVTHVRVKSGRQRSVYSPNTFCLCLFVCLIFETGSGFI